MNWIANWIVNYIYWSIMSEAVSATIVWVLGLLCIRVSMRISDYMINHSCSSFDHPMIISSSCKLPCTACMHLFVSLLLLDRCWSFHNCLLLFIGMAVVDGNLCLHVIIYFVYYIPTFLLAPWLRVQCVGGSLWLHTISTISTCSPGLRPAWSWVAPTSSLWHQTR